MKVYLVVTAKDLHSVTWASLNQEKAQKICLRACEKLEPHAVVTENWFDLPWNIRLELRKNFPKELAKIYE